MGNPDRVINNKLNNWKEKILGALHPEYYRFKVIVLNETVLAYHVNIDGIIIWVAKTLCDVGIEPNGKYYAIDIKEWFVIKNKLA